MRKLQLLLLMGPVLIGPLAIGQIVLTSPGSPATANFAGFDGGAAPAGWTVSDIVFQGYSTGSSTGGGLYSYGTDGTGNDTDRWLGVQFAGTPETATLSTTIINNTGSTITGISLAYDAFQFRAANGGRESFFEVTLDGGDPIDGLTFTALNSLATGARGTDLGDSAFAERLAASIGGIAVQDGASMTVTWHGFRGDGGGSAQGIGINNIEVAAIPEPALITSFLGVLVMGIVLLRRHRR